MTSQKVVILGTGGNSIDIVDTIDAINHARTESKYECIGFLDDDESSWGNEICGARVLGPLSCASRYCLDFDAWFVNGIGTSSNFWNKERIIARTEIPLDRFISLIHPSASMSRISEIGRGTVVFQNVTITSHVRIGNHVVILPNAVVSHNDSIGDYTCIASGACLAGVVKVGKACYLGTNCAVRERVRIGDYCLIGMGSVVLADVAENSVVAGVPARFLRATRPVLTD
jgi:sugar O-acyltransferase (sialic acid O-acetyltransferase NeuD family)